MAFPRGGSSSTVSRSNWNLEVLVFDERENRSTQRKTSRSRVENQQQTQPTCDAGSGNRTRYTLVGVKRSHHCANPAPPMRCSNRKGIMLHVVVLTILHIGLDMCFEVYSYCDCLQARLIEGISYMTIFIK